MTYFSSIINFGKKGNEKNVMNLNQKRNMHSKQRDSNLMCKEKLLVGYLTMRSVSMIG
jgi:hypothetical protein